MTRRNLFEVPYFHYKIHNWLGVKPSLLELIPDKVGTDFHDYQDPQDYPPYMQKVGEIIADPMQQFGQSYNIPCVITQAWYERSLKGKYHEAHNHGPTGFSAVLFVNFDPTCHKGTRFFSPFPHCTNGQLLTQQPHVDEGDLIIFPSSLLHEAPVNDSDKERLIISFNIMGEDVAGAYFRGLEQGKNLPSETPPED